MTNKDAKEYLIAHCYPDYPDEGKVMWDRAMHKAITVLSESERQEGKWLHFANSDDCPFCGYSTGKYERGRNYCPDCGARLE